MPVPESIQPTHSTKSILQIYGSLPHIWLEGGTKYCTGSSYPQDKLFMQGIVDVS